MQRQSDRGGRDPELELGDQSQGGYGVAVLAACPSVVHRVNWALRPCAWSRRPGAPRADVVEHRQLPGDRSLRPVRLAAQISFVDWSPPRTCQAGYGARGERV